MSSFKPECCLYTIIITIIMSSNTSMSLSLAPYVFFNVLNTACKVILSIYYDN